MLVSTDTSSTSWFSLSPSQNTYVGFKDFAKSSISKKVVLGISFVPMEPYLPQGIGLTPSATVLKERQHTRPLLQLETAPSSYSRSI